MAKKRGRKAPSPLVLSESEPEPNNAASDNEVEEQLGTQVDPEEEEEEVFEIAMMTEAEAKKKKEAYLRMEKDAKSDYRKGDTVFVEPEKCPNPENELLLWKAKIIEARKKNGLGHFAIFWYYKHQDSDELSIPPGSKFKPSEVCGKHELIESNHQDTVEEGMLRGKVKIIPLTDRPDQDVIGPDEFYSRALATLNPTSGSKKGKTTLKTHTAPCPLCGIHYRPEAEGDDILQNYCPCCNRWYHQHCLTNHKRAVDMYHTESDLSTLLRKNLSTVDPASPRKRARVDAEDDGEASHAAVSRKSKPTPASEKRALQTVQRIAGSQIVRGGQYGVAGDVKGICVARTILADVTARRKKLHDMPWEDEIGDALVQASSDFPVVTNCFKCPKCSKAI